MTTDESGSTSWFQRNLLLWCKLIIVSRTPVRFTFPFSSRYFSSRCLSSLALLFALFALLLPAPSLWYVSAFLVFWSDEIISRFSIFKSRQWFSAPQVSKPILLMLIPDSLHLICSLFFLPYLTSHLAAHHGRQFPQEGGCC